MKKIKLCGISLCTLLAATGANAAGYTCEELIQYTSCNPGYYLQETFMCPSGYIYKEGMCEDEEYMEMRFNDEDCAGDTIMHGDGCILDFVADGDLSDYYDDSQYEGVDLITEPLGVSTDCLMCPAGSICAGGTTASPTLCPAGSYCATAGLSQPTAQCAKGTYSLSGAAGCSSCPETGLYDKDGAPVATTTESTGSTSSAACYIGSNVYFKDAKGIYHFTQSCNYEKPTTYEDACEWNDRMNAEYCANEYSEEEYDTCMEEYVGNCGCDTHIGEFVFDEETGDFYCNDGM